MKLAQTALHCPTRRQGKQSSPVRDAQPINEVAAEGFDILNAVLEDGPGDHVSNRLGMLVQELVMIRRNLRR